MLHVSNERYTQIPSPTSGHHLNSPTVLKINLGNQWHPLKATATVFIFCNASSSSKPLPIQLFRLFYFIWKISIPHPNCPILTHKSVTHSTDCCNNEKLSNNSEPSCQLTNVRLQKSLRNLSSAHGSRLYSPGILPPYSAPGALFLANEYSTIRQTSTPNRDRTDGRDSPSS
jgi:hypothetical protein